jgi:hypothetical protein
MSKAQRSAEAQVIVMHSDQGAVSARSPLAVHTDELTEAIRDVEDALDGLRFGVSARVPLGPDHFLHWKKEGPDWLLKVEFPDGSEHPILSQSRKLRVLVADSLPALHAALLVEQARLDREVVDATRKVRTFIEHLEIER